MLAQGQEPSPGSLCLHGKHTAPDLWTALHPEGQGHFPPVGRVPLRLFFPGSVCRRSADTRSPALLLIFSRGKANDPNMTSGLPDVVPTQSGSIRPQLLCGSLDSDTRGASAPSSLATGAGVTQCCDQGCSPHCRCTARDREPTTCRDGRCPPEKAHRSYNTQGKGNVPVAVGSTT